MAGRDYFLLTCVHGAPAEAGARRRRVVFRSGGRRRSEKRLRNLAVDVAVVAVVVDGRRRGPAHLAVVRRRGRWRRLAAVEGAGRRAGRVAAVRVAGHEERPLVQRLRILGAVRRGAARRRRTHSVTHWVLRYHNTGFSKIR